MDLRAISRLATAAVLLWCVPLMVLTGCAVPQPPAAPPPPAPKAMGMMGSGQASQAREAVQASGMTGEAPELSPRQVSDSAWLVQGLSAQGSPQNQNFISNAG